MLRFLLYFSSFCSPGERHGCASLHLSVPGWAWTRTCFKNCSSTKNKNVIMNNNSLRLEWQVTLAELTERAPSRATEGRKCGRGRGRGDVNTAKLYYSCLLLRSHLVKLTVLSRLFCVTKV